MVLTCHVISENHVTEGLMTFGQKPIKVIYHPAKFSGHGHSGSGDILVYHIISQDQVIKVSYDLMGESLSLCASTLPGLVVIENMVLEMKTVILPQMQDIHNCIYPLTSTSFILRKAYDICATRVSNSNLRNNFYGKVQCA